MLANLGFFFQNRDVGRRELTAQFESGGETDYTAADDYDARSGTHIAFVRPKLYPVRVNSATTSPFAYG